MVIVEEIKKQMRIRGYVESEENADVNYLFDLQ